MPGRRAEDSIAMADNTRSGMQAATRVVFIMVLCASYIAVSSLLIRFNKHLVAPDRFPYPMALSALHMFCSLCLCSLFYLVRPSAFPSMAATEGKRAELLRWLAPIGLTFAISLYASNKAYAFANVTFLQFMKEGNVVITFLISCAVGLQVMNRVKFVNIIWITTFSALCVTGEVNFVWMGFALQLTSQLAECSRVVLGECVLNGSSIKLDPLTYTLFVAPTCLTVLLVGNAFLWEHEIVNRAVQLWHLLLPNAMLAFILNLLTATLVKEVSAVGAILAGVVKDMFLVVVSAAAFGEVVTHQQAACFVMILAGILFWSLSKAMPDHPFVVHVEGKMGLMRGETLPLSRVKAIQ